ncbi:MAG TPA: helical backbone metal receptor [Thermoanaerobaculia bacterium]|nr:helical backbone metal receptor [Thermoanaerobaculia bacterium]
MRRKPPRDGRRRAAFSFLLPLALGALSARAASPRRIVALAPSAAEIVLALGAGDRLVAVSDFARRLPGAEGKATVGGFTPDLERVLALEPDLVLASKDGTDRASFERLSAVGLKVEATSASSLAGVLEDIAKVGRLIGEESRAASLVAALRARVTRVEEEIRLRKAPPRRAAVVIWPDPPILAGPRTFVGDVLARAGYANVVPVSAGDWPRVSFETLAGWNPAVLVRPKTPENEDAFRRAFAKAGSWRLVPAARDGRVREVPGDLLERPGPRLVDALEILARGDAAR